MKRESRNWRDALTDAERAQLEPIEREIAEKRERLSWLSWQMHRIQNRASTRAGKATLFPVKQRHAAHRSKLT